MILISKLYNPAFAGFFHVSLYPKSLSVILSRQAIAAISYTGFSFLLVLPVNPEHEKNCFSPSHYFLCI